MPLVDIVDNIGYTRSAATKTISRHPEMFEGLKTFQSIDTPGRGKQQGTCLTEEGARRFLMLLSPSSTTKPELRQKIEEFKIQCLNKAVSAPVPAVTGQPPRGDPLAEALRHHADIADILIARYGYKEEVARGLAMAAVVEEVGDPALIYKGPAALPAAPEERKALECENCNGSLGMFDPDYEKYFSARKIAKFTGVTEDQVRNILEKEGLISWAHGITSLTMLGRQFGKVFITFPEWPHRTYEQKNIRWSNAAVERVKAHMMGQTALVPAG
jgi:hypothetical protein